MTLVRRHQPKGYNIIYQLLHWREDTALIFARKSISIPQKLLENQFLHTSDNFYHSALIKYAFTSIFGHWENRYTVIVPTALYNRSKTPNFLSILNLNIGIRIDKPR